MAVVLSVDTAVVRTTLAVYDENELE